MLCSMLSSFWLNHRHRRQAAFEKWALANPAAAQAVHTPNTAPPPLPATVLSPLRQLVAALRVVGVDPGVASVARSIHFAFHRRLHCFSFFFCLSSAPLCSRLSVSYRSSKMCVLCDAFNIASAAVFFIGCSNADVSDQTV
jgi:hypothetical protein